MSDHHTQPFIALRDAVIDELDDADRRLLVAIFGSMNEKRPSPSPAFVRAIALFAALGPDDRERFRRWCCTWLSKWGQIPRAAGMRHSPRATRDTPPD